MAHNKIESEGPQPPKPGQDESGPEGKQEPGPENEQEPGPESEQGSEAPSGPWEDPPRPPSPSGFNPDYWPQY
jgi:hypothetical protein